MRIELTTPDSPYKTVIDTDQYVTITEPYVGPILMHDGVCLAVFARDDGFEMNVWRWQEEAPLHHGDVIPGKVLMLSVHPERGVTVLNDGGSA